MEVYDNETSWGPTMECVPTKFLEVPFAPFSKAERLGKACDWYNQKNARFNQKFGASNAAFDFTWDENEGFELVDYDTSKNNRFHSGRRWQRSNWHHRRNQQDKNRYKQNDRRWKKHNKPVRRKRRWRYYQPYQQRQERIRGPSVDIQSTWTLRDEMDLKTLEKAKHFLEDEPTTLLSCGSVFPFDKTYERVNTKNDRPLDKTDHAFPKVTTSDDPHIRAFASEGAANIFATDAVLALLMACPRSVYPWDVVVNRVGNLLFFDKRDGSLFDYVTVGETALNPPDEDQADSINNKDALSKEATLINQAFSQQVLDKAQPPLVFEKPDPFAPTAEEGAGEEAVAPKGYVYRKWDLGDGQVLIARCDIDGYVKGVRGTNELLTINALNEFDPKTGMDWRRTIDSQGGAVLAAELKDNANKLAQVRPRTQLFFFFSHFDSPKWTARAILAGAEKMLFGFVSRVRVKDASLHAVLATQSYKTTEFARQISLRTSNMWGILRELSDRLLEMPEGKYVLLRDPNKAAVKIFKVCRICHLFGKNICVLTPRSLIQVPADSI
jgi:translation initiation factor 3 subunit D